eukprot:3099300-Amphidinium_carterae.1
MTRKSATGANRLALTSVCLACTTSAKHWTSSRTNGAKRSSSHARAASNAHISYNSCPFKAVASQSSCNVRNMLGMLHGLNSHTYVALLGCGMLPRNPKAHRRSNTKRSTPYLLSCCRFEGYLFKLDAV